MSVATTLFAHTMPAIFPTTYDPKKVEKRIYKLWLKSGFFNPDTKKIKNQKSKIKHTTKKSSITKRSVFVTLLPPPNITGSLHMGHALNATIQDILVRMKRMEGYETLWLPGIDHAGIATQNVVEKELKKEGVTRFDLGRERFIKRVWQWKKQYGETILAQLKDLGASCDWSRTVFTMDPYYYKRVLEAFIHYYKKGWLHRAKRVISWCPRCKTSLSDLELEYKETKGMLWHIRYKLRAQSAKRKANETNTDYIVVATTRPETMLGDEAVAVNPKDERYKHLVGEKVILPIQEKEIPIIGDSTVDPAFGTGMVKVTPAHDVTDYEIALRHNLPLTQVIDENGKLTRESKICEGLSVEECRKKVVESLRNQNLIEKEEPYIHNVAYCYRCEETVEPLPSLQWFLKMGDLAMMAIEAVEHGKVTFSPKRWEKVYFDWLKNIRDWCVSRQLWWGQQIPIWYCGGQQKIPEHTMGFHKNVVVQIFKGKTKTYRLRDHGFKVGDKVLFENSQTKTYFGYGIITHIEKTKVGKIDYKDKTHYKTYRNLKELINAFKFHFPNKKITPQSTAYLYMYDFHRFTEKDAEKGCGQVIASIVKPKQCPACKGTNVHQDHDVLDTWFSSALWPYATLKTQRDVARFYPSDVLVTARDIINLWVARMIFSGIAYMGREPFFDVLIHPTVLTKEGKRMSKSLGTGIDPILLIEKYGADATRFGIAYQLMGGQDLKFGEENMVMGKKFCNKIWNASRFVLTRNSESSVALVKDGGPKAKTHADKRILNALKKTIREVTKYIEAYEFGRAAHTLYDFFWHDFCDVYLERSKKQRDEKTNIILLFVLFQSLKLFHPFIPFITEEIYQKLPTKKRALLLVEDWPKA